MKNETLRKFDAEYSVGDTVRVAWSNDVKTIEKTPEHYTKTVTMNCHRFQTWDYEKPYFMLNMIMENQDKYQELCTLKPEYREKFATAKNCGEIASLLGIQTKSRAPWWEAYGNTLAKKRSESESDEMSLYIAIDFGQSHCISVQYYKDGNPIDKKDLPPIKETPEDNGERTFPVSGGKILTISNLTKGLRYED